MSQVTRPIDNGNSATAIRGPLQSKCGGRKEHDMYTGLRAIRGTRSKYRTKESR